MRSLQETDRLLMRLALFVLLVTWRFVLLKLTRPLAGVSVARQKALERHLVSSLAITRERRRMARPAGLEPAPPGLEEQWSYSEAAFFGATCGTTHASDRRETGSCARDGRSV